MGVRLLPGLWGQFGMLQQRLSGAETAARGCADEDNGG
jgi:hypothetical protein